MKRSGTYVLEDLAGRIMLPFRLCFYGELHVRPPDHLSESHAMATNNPMKRG